MVGSRMSREEWRLFVDFDNNPFIGSPPSPELRPVSEIDLNREADTHKLRALNDRIVVCRDRITSMENMLISNGFLMPGESQRLLAMYVRLNELTEAKNKIQYNYLLR